MKNLTNSLMKSLGKFTSKASPKKEITEKVPETRTDCKRELFPFHYKKDDFVGVVADIISSVQVMTKPILDGTMTATNLFPRDGIVELLCKEYQYPERDAALFIEETLICLGVFGVSSVGDDYLYLTKRMIDLNDQEVIDEPFFARRYEEQKKIMVLCCTEGLNPTYLRMMESLDPDLTEIENGQCEGLFWFSKNVAYKFLKRHFAFIKASPDNVSLIYQIMDIFCKKARVFTRSDKDIYIHHPNFGTKKGEDMYLANMYYSLFDEPESSAQVTLYSLPFFNTDLSIIMKRKGERGVVPQKFSHLVAFLLDGSATEGIFRISGCGKKKEELMSHLSLDVPVNLSSYDVHDVSGVFKKYLSGITWFDQDQVENLYQSYGSEEFLPEIRKTVQKLNITKFEMLRLTIRICADVVNEIQTSSMDAHSLGVCFGPTIFHIDRKDSIEVASAKMKRAIDSITCMITHFDEVFTFQK